MKFFLIAAVFFALLTSPPATAAKKKPMVGGACSYEEYPGRCTVTGRDKSGRSLFTFVGEVDGKDVNLQNNAMVDGISVPGGSMACKLLFIKKGTCTPCVFSIGECGSKAWDLFRAGAKKQKKR